MADRFWTPNQGYDLEVSIGGVDFSRELESCAISYSLSTYYPLINLSLLVSTNSILDNELYGQDSIKLIIRFLGSQDGHNAPSENEYVTELLTLNSDFELPMTESDISNVPRQPERLKINFVTVPKDSFKIMSSIVNKVYLQKNMKHIVNDLITTAGGTPKIDTSGLTVDPLDQIACPPKSLISNLRSLDSIYSIHSGASTIFCDHEKNVHVKNLSYRMNTREAFTVYQLSNTQEENLVLTEQQSGDPTPLFYTTAPISSEYELNAKIASMAKITNYIIKPKDILYYIYKADLKNWAEDYGLKDGNGKLFSDRSLDTRTKYTMNNSAWPYDARNEFTEASLIKSLANLSSINISIDRYFDPFYLFKLGEPILYKTNIQQYLTLSGKYILTASDIIFTKQKSWNAMANLTAIRTNRSKGE